MALYNYAPICQQPNLDSILLVDQLINPVFNEVSFGKDTNPTGYCKIIAPNPEYLLATVAHDLRNPLGASVSLLNILMDDDGLKEEHREILTLIKETTRHSLNLVDGLLKTHKAKSEPAKTDLNKAITHCVNILSNKALLKKQQLCFNCNGKQETATISEDNVCRVLNNLVSNAIKFTPVGGTITIELNSTPDEIRISVRDNGIGIPLALRHKIFNDHSGSGRPGTQGEESFGLGLPICRRIVQEHGGKINFSSIPLKGTIFYFTLPKIAA